jgi:hypothetical protein
MYICCDPFSEGRGKRKAQAHRSGDAPEVWFVVCLIEEQMNVSPWKSVTF